MAEKGLNKKPFLIFINPRSGCGNCLSLFQSQISPLLNEANLSYHAIITFSKGMAFKIVKDMIKNGFIDDKLIYLKQNFSINNHIITKNDDNISLLNLEKNDTKKIYNSISEKSDNIFFENDVNSLMTIKDCKCDNSSNSFRNEGNTSFKSQNIPYQAILCVSGDGTVYEVFNGLMESGRGDIPVGVIPGGSGNGLACSIRWRKGDTLDDPVLSAVSNVIEGQTISLDLMKIITPNNVFYSFLSFGWGFLSDIDIESEGLRKLFGEARFAVWVLVRLMVLRKYPCRLSFLPTLGHKTLDNITSSNEKIKCSTTENSQLFDKQIDKLKIESNAKKGRINKLSKLLNRIRKLTKKKYKKSSKDILEDNTSCEKVDINLANEFLISKDGQKEIFKIEHENISLSSPVPSNWVTIEDDFILIYATITSHICSGAPFAPSKFDDGIIWLTYLKGDVTRKQILTFVRSLETGDHYVLPWVQRVPVRIFRIEPKVNKGYMTIDGEKIDVGVAQGEVIDRAGTLIC